MQIPILPFALGAIALTFALAVLGWWVASRVQRRRRVARRTAAARSPEQDAGPREAGGR